jgi:hypothetical protein
MVFTQLLLDQSTPELRKFPFGVLAAQPEEVALVLALSISLSSSLSLSLSRARSLLLSLALSHYLSRIVYICSCLNYLFLFLCEFI